MNYICFYISLLISLLFSIIHWWLFYEMIELVIIVYFHFCWILFVFYIFTLLSPLFSIIHWWLFLWDLNWWFTFTFQFFINRGIFIRIDISVYEYFIPDFSLFFDCFTMCESIVCLCVTFDNFSFNFTAIFLFLNISF